MFGPSICPRKRICVRARNPLLFAVVNLRTRLALCLAGALAVLLAPAADAVEPYRSRSGQLKNEPLERDGLQGYRPKVHRLKRVSPYKVGRGEGADYYARPRTTANRASR